MEHEQVVSPNSFHFDFHTNVFRFISFSLVTNISYISTSPIIYDLPWNLKIPFI